MWDLHSKVIEADIILGIMVLVTLFKDQDWD
jgi:hypothetical protein